MSRVPLPIANGFYKSDSLPLSAQECVGWYPVILEGQGLNREVLYGTPGLEQVVTAGDTAYANRGGHRFEDKAYFVQGSKLYRLNSGSTLTDLGTISGTGRVSMADNGTQLMILVPGGAGYIFTEGPDTLTTISDVDFTASGAPQHVVFIDGYFCCTTDSKKFIISALNDGTSWNALDFGPAEVDPDQAAVPLVFKNQLFIAGSTTIEGFSNTGNAAFPFQRNGIFMERGVKAPFSLINGHDAFYFIGGGEDESPAIWRSTGGDPEKISTGPIDSLLQSFSEDEISEAFAWAYAQKGAYFIGFSLPTTCLVFDSVSGRWHERKSIVTNVDSTVETLRWRANSIVSSYGELYVGDSQDGRIGRMDIDVYAEYDEVIFRRVATQPFQNSMQSFFVPHLELTVESGMGNADVPNPAVVMDRSMDGKTWTAPRQREIGEKGQYGRRVIWRRNGRASRFETFRFTLTDPVKPVILQLTADIIPGTK